MKRQLILFSLTLLGPLLVVGPAWAQSDRPAQTSVGMTGRMEQVILPGTELEAIPYVDRKTPIVLRIVRAYPHGTAHRYDLEYDGVEPGAYDLKDYLRRKDGSSTKDLPALPVRVTSLLPPGQVLPNTLTIHDPPWIGGYGTLLWTLGALWVLGLFAIVYLGFLRRPMSSIPQEQIAPQSLADRLRPLVEGAMAGKLAQPQLANLERTLLAFWRRRLRLEKTEPAEAMETLRSHPEAGPLLEQLEIWLHRPGATQGVDPQRLLQPYKDLPAEALE